MGAEFHYISEFTLTMLYIKISVGAVAAFSAKEDIKFLGLKEFQIKAVPRTLISSFILKDLLLGRERVSTVCYRPLCPKLRGSFLPWRFWRRRGPGLRQMQSYPE